MASSQFTISRPEFTYAKLKLTTTGPDTITLDDLMAKAYYTDALRQYLGLTGESIPIDILQNHNNTCWVRLPRLELDNFAAALTTFKGRTEGETRWTLTLEGASDFLGTMVKDGPPINNRG